MKIFFKKNGLILNWNEFDKLSLEQQINTSAMISPISNEEKQKLVTREFRDLWNMLWIHVETINRKIQNEYWNYWLWFNR